MEKRKGEFEISLVNAKLTALKERKKPSSRNLACVDLVWPRKGIARKSAARETLFHKGMADVSGEEWAKRILFREEIDSHTALAVSVTESITVQKLKRFARLTAKYALRMGADFMEQAMVGYAEIASAPIDALSTMVGDKDAPKAIAQGLVDIFDLPGPGEEKTVEIPLLVPGGKRSAGIVTLLIKGLK